MRWGRVFRSGALDGLSPTDLALYDGLGIRTVFDLRTDVEREERPSAVASCSLTLVGRPSGGAASPPGPAPRTAAEAEQRLLDLYCGLLDHGAAEIGTLLTTLAGDDGLPAVIHCQAGKDRTGVVTAVLLELLGVDRTVVVEDYALTERYLERDRLGTTVQRLLALGYSEEAVAALLGTSVPAMAAALEHLDGQHGGIERYLTGPAGMHPDQMDRLRRRLVDTAD